MPPPRPKEIENRIKKITGKGGRVIGRGKTEFFRRQRDLKTLIEHIQGISDPAVKEKMAKDTLRRVDELLKKANMKHALEAGTNIHGMMRNLVTLELLARGHADWATGTANTAHRQEAFDAVHARLDQIDAAYKKLVEKGKISSELIAQINTGTHPGTKSMTEEARMMQRWATEGVWELPPPPTEITGAAGGPEERPPSPLERAGKPAFSFLAKYASRTHQSHLNRFVQDILRTTGWDYRHDLQTQSARLHNEARNSVIREVTGDVVDNLAGAGVALDLSTGNHQTALIEWAKNIFGERAATRLQQTLETEEIPAGGATLWGSDTTIAANQSALRNVLVRFMQKEHRDLTRKRDVTKVDTGEDAIIAAVQSRGIDINSPEAMEIFKEFQRHQIETTIGLASISARSRTLHGREGEKEVVDELDDLMHTIQSQLGTHMAYDREFMGIKGAATLHGRDFADVGVMSIVAQTVHNFLKSRLSADHNAFLEQEGKQNMVHTIRAIKGLVSTLVQRMDPRLGRSEMRLNSKQFVKAFEKGMGIIDQLTTRGGEQAVHGSAGDIGINYLLREVGDNLVRQGETVDEHGAFNIGAVIAANISGEGTIDEGTIKRLADKAANPVFFLRDMKGDFTELFGETDFGVFPEGTFDIDEVARREGDSERAARRTGAAGFEEMAAEALGDLERIAKMRPEDLARELSGEEWDELGEEEKTARIEQARQMIENAKKKLKEAEKEKAAAGIGAGKRAAVSGLSSGASAVQVKGAGMKSMVPFMTIALATGVALLVMFGGIPFL